MQTHLVTKFTLYSTGWGKRVGEKLVQIKNGLGKMKLNWVLRRCDRCNYMMLERKKWTLYAQIWKWTLLTVITISAYHKQTTYGN